MTPDGWSIQEITNEKAILEFWQDGEKTIWLHLTRKQFDELVELLSGGFFG